MVTLLVALSILGLLLAAASVWALLLRLGLYWAKAPVVTWRRVALVTTLVILSQIPFAVVALAAENSDSEAAAFILLATLGEFVLFQCVMIVLVFKTSFFRAIQAWLPTLLTAAIVLPFGFVMFRPLLVEAFRCPANSMAPTLLGKHVVGTCTECGGPAYGSPIRREYAYAGADAEPRPMICRDHFHVTFPTDRSDEVVGGDRFLVAKFLQPRRWDLIVFRYPEEPEVMFVKRLVGMPGEEITIKDGAVWADGKRLKPPEPIREIRYVSEMGEMEGGSSYRNAPYGEPKLWGSPDRPAKLADDEYFVLGDFSVGSKDSRLWRTGAPGHHPYAVPKSYFRGVVTHIYWPPSRCRTLR